MAQQEINSVVETAVNGDSNHLADVSPATDNALDLGSLRHVPMTVQVEVGRTSLTLGEILDDLDVGSSVRLDRHAGEPVDVYVNGALFARAEVVVMQDQIGAKIIEIVDGKGLRSSAAR